MTYRRLPKDQLPQLPEEWRWIDEEDLVGNPCWDASQQGTYAEVQVTEPGLVESTCRSTPPRVVAAVYLANGIPLPPDLVNKTAPDPTPTPAPSWREVVDHLTKRAVDAELRVMQLELELEKLRR